MKWILFSQVKIALFPLSMVAPRTWFIFSIYTGHLSTFWGDQDFVYAFEFLNVWPGFQYVFENSTFSLSNKIKSIRNTIYFTTVLTSIPLRCVAWWSRLKRFQIRKKRKKRLFGNLESSSQKSDEQCKKALNWWILTLRSCVYHEMNPFFMSQNRSVPFIDGRSKNMIYFFNIYWTSFNFLRRSRLRVCIWNFERLTRISICFRKFHFFFFHFPLSNIKRVNTEHNWFYYLHP